MTINFRDRKRNSCDLRNSAWLSQRFYDISRFEYKRTLPNRKEWEGETLPDCWIGDYWSKNQNYTILGLKIESNISQRDLNFRDERRVEIYVNTHLCWMNSCVFFAWSCCKMTVCSRCNARHRYRQAKLELPPYLLPTDFWILPLVDQELRYYRTRLFLFREKCRSSASFDRLWEEWRKRCNIWKRFPRIITSFPPFKYPIFTGWSICQKSFFNFGLFGNEIEDVTNEIWKPYKDVRLKIDGKKKMSFEKIKR